MEVAIAADDNNELAKLRANPPIMPKEPDWTKIGREDFCNLDIDTLVWLIFRDPRKAIEKYRKIWLPI